MSGRSSPPLPVYMDYAATTPVDARVAEAMSACLTREGAFGNPGSTSHAYGEAASALVERARIAVAAAVGADPADIVWTSGATEANNLALFGIAHYYRDSGRHIVTVRTEHKAVLDPCRELERRGWRVTYLEPATDGMLAASDVAAALRSDTVLVSVMHVNNEIGVIQDIVAIAAVCAAHGRVRLHVDAAQSVGKCPLDFSGMGIDLLSLSAHKAYGPKGVGALVVARGRGVHLQPLHFGGGQERGLRAGTVATHQVVGMGEAFARASAESALEIARIALLRDRLWSGLAELGGILRNGNAQCCAAHLLNVSVEDVEGESLLAAVRASICVSTGSACTSAAREPSYVLRALGRTARLAESSLRFSLGRFSTLADVEVAVASVTWAVAHLRRIAGSALGPAAIAAAMDTSGASRVAMSGGAAGSQYSDLTRSHFETASAAGRLDGPNVRCGTAGSPELGTWIRFDVRFDLSGGEPTLDDVTFLAFGCPHVIAVADWVAQHMRGCAAESRLPESVASLQRRFDVPVEKLGRLLLLEDAWLAAVSPPSRV